MLDLADKAKIESLYWDISEAAVQSFKGQAYVPEEIRKLEGSLGDQYRCNFSVFQSLRDHWALGPRFPSMPRCRRGEKPSRAATLVDITCDSDGQINTFIDLQDVRDTLPLHALNRNDSGKLDPYYLGFFLMGAYQDIMGDLHNLFGRVNELHVFLDPDEATGYYVEEIIEGTTIIQALSAVQYDEHELKRRMKAQMDEAKTRRDMRNSRGRPWLGRCPWVVKRCEKPWRKHSNERFQWVLRLTFPGRVTKSSKSTVALQRRSYVRLCVGVSRTS
jgi:arginine decarboxylase